MGLLDDLGVAVPVLAAPMAGGPMTPELAVAADEVGSLAFLAGGYKTAAALGEQLDAVRARTSRYGVNLFAPNPVPVDRAEYARYRASLQREADRLGVELPAAAVEDDDHWRDKVDLLVAQPPPIVSFAFGIPDADVVRALHRAGSLLAQTVTSADEAAQAAAAGLDVLVVQAADAGGHSGTLTPRTPAPVVPLAELVSAVGATTSLPVIAAGGVSSATEVADALRAGAVAVAVGTALLLAPEAGTSEPHRRALREDRGATVVTHAFTGRPARALCNRFVREHDEDGPYGYPAIHHLTSPLRKAAAAAGDAESVHLWAGAGYRSATDRPAGETLRRLSGEG